MSSGYRIRLAKEDFKFSVAHFTVFGRERAERLHGHNYRMYVEVSGGGIDELGLLVDIEDLKRRIRSLCRDLDSLTLLPSECSLVDLGETADEVEVAFAERRYRLPRADVRILPLCNTTLEELARFAWESLAPHLDRARASELSVEIEETDGQSCRYHATLEP